jgi:hypothetical protein
MLTASMTATEAETSIDIFISSQRQSPLPQWRHDFYVNVFIGYVNLYILACKPFHESLEALYSLDNIRFHALKSGRHCSMIGKKK